MMPAYQRVGVRTSSDIFNNPADAWYTSKSPLASRAASMTHDYIARAELFTYVTARIGSGHDNNDWPRRAP